MEREPPNDELLVLSRIRRRALRWLDDGDEGARFIVLAVEGLIREREMERVNDAVQRDTIDDR